MSLTLFSLANSFKNERLSANEFANAYIELWKYEGGSGILQQDTGILNECLSSIFCLADLYNPEIDREAYELDEEQLREKISELIENMQLGELVSCTPPI